MEALRNNQPADCLSLHICACPRPMEHFLNSLEPHLPATRATGASTCRQRAVRRSTLPSTWPSSGPSPAPTSASRCAQPRRGGGGGRTTPASTSPGGATPLGAIAKGLTHRARYPVPSPFFRKAGGGRRNLPRAHLRRLQEVPRHVRARDRRPSDRAAVGELGGSDAVAAGAHSGVHRRGQVARHRRGLRRDHVRPRPPRRGAGRRRHRLLPLRVLGPEARRDHVCKATAAASATSSRAPSSSTAPPTSKIRRAPRSSRTRMPARRLVPSRTAPRCSTPSSRGVLPRSGRSATPSHPIVSHAERGRGWLASLAAQPEPDDMASFYPLGPAVRRRQFEQLLRDDQRVLPWLCAAQACAPVATFCCWGEEILGDAWQRESDPSSLLPLDLASSLVGLAGARWRSRQLLNWYLLDVISSSPRPRCCSRPFVTPPRAQATACGAARTMSMCSTTRTVRARRATPRRAAPRRAAPPLAPLPGVALRASWSAHPAC